MLTRMEVTNMRDLGLQLAYDRLSSRLSEDFRRGAPGKLSDVYDLALVRFEADLRGVPLARDPHPGQLRLAL